MARAAISKKGLYGKVSANVFDGTSLPYVDNLVNLLVVSGASSVDGNEIARVLAPSGMAILPRDSQLQVPALSPQPSALWRVDDIHETSPRRHRLVDPHDA